MIAGSTLLADERTKQSRVVETADFSEEKPLTPKRCKLIDYVDCRHMIGDGVRDAGFLQQELLRA